MCLVAQSKSVKRATRFTLVRGIVGFVQAQGCLKAALVLPRESLSQDASEIFDGIRRQFREGPYFHLICLCSSMCSSREILHDRAHERALLMVLNGPPRVDGQQNQACSSFLHLAAGFRALATHTSHYRGGGETPEC